MGISARPMRARTLYRSMVILLPLLAGIAGCATTRTNQAEDVQVRTIWKAREQYVAIEKQDLTGGAAVAANAHPADISVDRLRDALESIEVSLPGKDKALSLLNGPEVGILSENIRNGLASAGPDEDVTFAVIGQYPTLLGLFHERRVTVGRVFCRDGRLNIIFGDVLRDVNENEDRRLYPFLAASRSVAAAGNWALKRNPGGEEFTLKRSDWLTFPMAPSPVVRHDTADSGTASKVEERLRALGELQRKRLITDEEYRAKRREILKDL